MDDHVVLSEFENLQESWRLYACVLEGARKNMQKFSFTQI